MAPRACSSAATFRRAAEETGDRPRFSIVANRSVNRETAKLWSVPGLSRLPAALRGAPVDGRSSALVLAHGCLGARAAAHHGKLRDPVSSESCFLRPGARRPAALRNGKPAHATLRSARRAIDFLRLPLIAAVGMLFYGEPLGMPILRGAAVIFAGTYYSIRRESRQPGTDHGL